VLAENATLSEPRLPATHEKNLWRNLRLRRAFIELQAALGECMYTAGIDDGELGARISAVDEQLHRAETDEDCIQALTAARRELILQLAAAALEDDGPLPGADVAYCRARDSQAALIRDEKSLGDRRKAGLE
jgi:hypothetical protein